jgi:predicted negative regulator of RcsB-dependent stress response
MAVYDLEEQEQLDELKAWWTRHGNRVASVVIAGCVVYLGWQGWRWYEAGHLDAASALYSAVQDAARNDNAAKAKEAMAQLTDRYAGTPYAPRAALLDAKILWDAGDKAGARARLQWAMERAGDNDLAQVARYRMAETWLDDGKPDEALKLLDAKTDDAFTALYADLRGDALVAAGRKDDARKAYESALTKFDVRSAYRNYVEVKYHAIGGGDAPQPPTAAGAFKGGGKAAADATGVSPTGLAPAPAAAAPTAPPAAPLQSVVAPGAASGAPAAPKDGAKP